MDEELQQIEELYNYSNEVDTTNGENEKKIFENIAMMLLLYTISNNIMKLSNKEYVKSYGSFKSLVQKVFSGEVKTQQANVLNLLEKVANGKASIYGNALSKQEVLKIINSKYKGDYWYSRLLKNKTDTSKQLLKTIKDFLKGDISVNDIKGRIDKVIKYDNYKTRRLIETENARVQSEIAEKHFKETGVKKVQYIATLDGQTCANCVDFDGEIYELNDPARIQLPAHSNCRCYYVEVKE